MRFTREAPGRQLVDVAPRPGLPRLDRPDERMVRQPKVLRGVLVRGRVAAADVAARETHPQVDPRVAGLGAIFADRRSGPRDFDGSGACMMVPSSENLLRTPESIVGLGHLAAAEERVGFTRPEGVLPRFFPVRQAFGPDFVELGFGKELGRPGSLRADDPLGRSVEIPGLELVVVSLTHLNREIEVNILLRDGGSPHCVHRSLGVDAQKLPVGRLRAKDVIGEGIGLALRLPAQHRAGALGGQGETVRRTLSGSRGNRARPMGARDEYGCHHRNHKRPRLDS
jgi:hypothetical protein